MGLEKLEGVIHQFIDLLQAQTVQKIIDLINHHKEEFIQEEGVKYQQTINSETGYIEELRKSKAAKRH